MVPPARYIYVRISLVHGKPTFFCWPASCYLSTFFFFIRFHFLMEKATTTTTTTTKDKGNYSSRQAHSRVVKSVCGIRVQRGGIIDQKSGIYDHSLGIRDLKPQDRISSFFRNQGSGCIIFVGSGIKLCQASGINDQKFGYINKISDEKYTSLQACS